MPEINDILTWIVPSILGTLLAVFTYINKEGFRRGSQKGQSEVTTTVLGNTIKELELTKELMSELSKKLDVQNGMIIRLEERLRFTCQQLNDLKSRLSLPTTRFEDEQDEKLR